jgi:hypothetical protein
MQSVEYYLSQAEDCRNKAEQARDANEKEYWLRMMAEWLILADRAEGEPTWH